MPTFQDHLGVWFSSTPSYSTAQTVTCVVPTTTLAAAAYRQSNVIDNTTDLFVDVMIGGSIQVGTSPVAGTLEVYAYGTFDGTNYTGGASGTASTYTADGEEARFKLIEAISVDSTSDQDYVWGPTSVCAQANWPCLPPKWGIVIRNNTSAAINTTGTNNICKFIGIK